MTSMVLTLLAAAIVLATTPVLAADDSKVKAATRQVEDGARTIGQGSVGRGVEETARGVGNTVVEGAKFAGAKLEESGRAAEGPARRAWRHTREGAVAFGQSVKRFFSTLFSN